MSIFELIVSPNLDEKLDVKIDISSRRKHELEVLTVGGVGEQIIITALRIYDIYWGCQWKENVGS